MSLPGFTAETSLYKTKKHHQVQALFLDSTKRYIQHKGR
jgi:hypothetical protein